MRRALAYQTLLILICTGGCTGQQPATSNVHPGIIWVQTSAEYQAVSRQAYNSATATLEQAIADPSWSALPDQTDAAAKPVAVIFDVDETLVSNAAFQAILEPPFRNQKLDDWNAANVATPVPGAADFARAARAAGATLFFVTNRPCEKLAGNDDPCPQEKTTIQDLVESGIPADSEHVMLSNERPEWTREKVIRRNHVAQTHRVIFLVGDDLGDFIACSRARPLDPCSEGATIASRDEATRKYSDYWGSRWYVLPNPMHGSWTTVR